MRGEFIFRRRWVCNELHFYSFCVMKMMMKLNNLANCGNFTINSVILDVAFKVSHPISHFYLRTRSTYASIAFAVCAASKYSNEHNAYDGLRRGMGDVWGATPCHIARADQINRQNMAIHLISTRQTKQKMKPRRLVLSHSSSKTTIKIRKH